MANQYPLLAIKDLSYSSLCLLHSCPRKYALQKSMPRAFSFSEAASDLVFGDEAERAATEEKKAKSNITLAFGTTVGVGIQSWMMGKSEAEIAMDCFLAWSVDLDEADPKSKKSFPEALIAVDKFQYLQSFDINIEDYEIALIPGSGRPATELGFRIALPDGFFYRGFIDAVLVNKFTGEYVVLECKTTGAKYISAAKYQNSEQALGYALVLDKLFGDQASYGVLYTVYLSVLEKWETFYFSKGPAQRAQWIMNTLTDLRTLSHYVEQNYFPAYGESCEAWNRPCAYLGMCHTDLSAFFKEQDTAEDISAYDVHISLEELMAAQGAL